MVCSRWEGQGSCADRHCHRFTRGFNPWLPACTRLRPQVDVVGVEGELKEVAMQALNTRANFAYTQKEVCAGGGRLLLWGEHACVRVNGVFSGACVALLRPPLRTLATHHSLFRNPPATALTHTHPPTLTHTPTSLHTAHHRSWTTCTRTYATHTRPPTPHPTSLTAHHCSSQIMDDMHRVFNTGYFSLCTPRAEGVGGGGGGGVGGG